MPAGLGGGSGVGLPETRRGGRRRLHGIFRPFEGPAGTSPAGPSKCRNLPHTCHLPPLYPGFRQGLPPRDGRALRVRHGGNCGRVFCGGRVLVDADPRLWRGKLWVCPTESGAAWGREGGMRWRGWAGGGWGLCSAAHCRFIARGLPGLPRAGGEAAPTWVVPYITLYNLSVYIQATVIPNEVRDLGRRPLRGDPSLRSG